MCSPRSISPSAIMASPDKLSRPRHTGANWEGEGLLLGRPRRESLSPLASWLIGGQFHSAIEGLRAASKR